MSKVRVYDLAKQYGMKGPELAKELKRIGFDNIKSHMAVLDAADEMLVVARLEAHGYKRASAVADPDGASGPGGLRKKGLPSKKALPPIGTQELPRKKTDDDGNEAVEVEATPEIVEPTPEPTPEEQPAPEAAAPSEEPPSEDAADATDTPVAEEPPAVEPPAVEPPADDTPATDAAPAGDAAPAADGDKPTPEGDEPKPVKRLLIPKAKAQVVGRIDLPQETIRDATRRSAPASARDVAADRKLRRMALQSTQSRTASRGPTRPGMRRGPGGGRPGGMRGRRTKTATPVSTVDPNKIIEIEPPFRIKDLSEAFGIKVTDLITTLAFQLGVKGKTINSFLSSEEVELVALEINRKVKIVEHKEAEEELLQSIVEDAQDETDYTRAPVITFMGHVDHGKTTLLDALRSSDVVKGEAGGITQHIGAYRVTHESGNTFVILDTPGHAAFTSMRARGASLTDIVVLVVAADDGVMPQTEEAIAHAKEADVPIVVAVNKCDKPGTNPMQVRQQLSVKGLQTEEWGGKTQVVDVSATTGQGLDELVEKIMLESEILELTAKPTVPGIATVVESKQTPEQGVVVNVLVTNGTLRVKDRVLCGESLSRIRGMTDDHGRQVAEAGPSTPVTVIGIDDLPQPGDNLYAVSDLKKAKEVAADRQRRSRDLSLAERSTVTAANLSDALAAAKAEEIKVILRADVMGSLEPIKNVLSDLNTAEVRVNMILTALGGITENDVAFAEASGAMIIGFNSVPDVAARQAADRAGVQVKFYDIIYSLIDDMKVIMEGKLAPDEVEEITGHAEVKAVFKSSKFGNIAGCYVNDGMINRNNKVRVSRDGRVIYNGPLAGLRREKDDAKEVKAGFECGMTLEKFNDVKVGDQIESYAIELVKRTLE